MLRKGDTVKNIEFLLDTDVQSTLQDELQGSKYLVLYFYPKDDTPGCTTQACALRDGIDDLQKAGVKVLGVGKGDLNSHKKFKSKYNLNFDLIVDDDLEISEYFGTIEQKTMFGKTYKGINRTTFVIDKNMKVVTILENVNPSNHLNDVLDFIYKQYTKK